MMGVALWIGGLVGFGFVLGFHCGGHCGWVDGGLGVLDLLESSSPESESTVWGWRLSWSLDFPWAPSLRAWIFLWWGVDSRLLFAGPFSLHPLFIRVAFWHFAGGASSLLGVGLFGPFRYFFLEGSV